MIQARKWKIKNKKWKFQAGFTLLEILVVMTVVGLLGSMIVVIFFNSLRSSNKSNAVIQLRQNGNYALTQITNVVRFAKKVGAPICYDINPSAGKTLTVTSVDDVSTTYTCPPNASGTLTFSNGTTTSPLFDKNVIKVAACAFTCQQESLVTPPVIGINFLLTTGANTNASETTASLPFSTTITLRNYRQ